MEPISSTVVLTGLLGFGKECISDHLKETVIRHVTILPKKILKALQDIEAPVNNHVEKAAYAAQWLATKLFVQQLLPQHHNLGTEPFERIEDVANEALKQIEDDKYVPPNALLGNNNIVTLASDETFGDWNHLELGRQLKETHLDDIKQRLPKGVWHNRTAFEKFEQSLEVGCEIHSKANEKRAVQWFELVCAFFNELLKGDNNKAKDSYQNQLLTKISLQNQELKESFVQATNQFDQHFIADRIGTALFEEIKILVHDELMAISNTLNRVEDKVDKTYEKVTQIDRRLGNIQDALSKPTDSDIKFLTLIPPIDTARLIGRVNDIRCVLDKLETPAAQVLIHAMKGLGKTTLAKAVTKVILSRKQLTHVAWINGGNDLLNALIEQIGRIRLKEKVEQAFEEKKSPQEIVSLLIVPYLLDQSGSNLLVIDNLTHDQRSVYNRVCAGLANWRILATSYEQVGDKFDVYTLPFLSVNEARDLFYRYYESTEQDDTSVDTLIKAVGYHTLTIELIAKTGDALGFTPTRLLTKFIDKGLALNTVPLDLDSDHSIDPVDGLLPYYEVIFDLSDLNDLEKTILLQLSILPPGWFNEALITTILNIEQDANKEELLNAALKRLVDRGWLQKSQQSCLMHQIVQTIIRHKLQPTARNCEATVHFFISVLSQLGQSNPVSFINAIPSIETVLSYLNAENDVSINNLSRYLGQLQQTLGNYKAAEDQFLYTLHKVATLGSSEFPSVTDLYNNLGAVNLNKGDYDSAIKYYEKVISIQLSENSLDLAVTYNNLGSVYNNKENYAVATKYYKKALRIWQTQPGENHSEISMSYNNLGLVYTSLTEYNKAVKYYRKSLKIKRETLHKGHPSFASTYGNLGLMYTNQGVHKEAIKWLKRALAIWENRLGKEHPSVASVYNNLGIIYSNTDDYPKSIEYFEKALVIREKRLSADHPDTIGTYGNLSIVYYKDSNFIKAAKYYEKAIYVSQNRQYDSSFVRKLIDNIKRFFKQPPVASFFKKAVSQKDDFTIALLRRIQVLLRQFNDPEINLLLASILEHSLVNTDKSH